VKNILLILLCASFGLTVGCLVSNNSQTTRSGKEVTEPTLAQLEIGETTRAWVEATLGVPSSSRVVDEQTEIISYTATRTTKKQSSLIFIFKSNKETDDRETVFLEFKESVLNRYWESSE